MKEKIRSFLGMDKPITQYHFYAGILVLGIMLTSQNHYIESVAKELKDK